MSTSTVAAPAAQIDRLVSAMIQRGYQLNLSVVSRAKDSYQQALNINGQ